MVMTPSAISLSSTAFLALLQLCDTALPAGAFSFSNGLETYTQEGVIADAATFQAWLESVLRHTVHGSHLLPVALAYRAAAAEDWPQLERLDQQLTAMKHARELREASVKAGQRLLRLARDVWPGPAVEHLHTLWRQGTIASHHAVVLGVLGCALELGERVTVEAAGYMWLSSMISAALRLFALGQSAGQRVLTSLLTCLPAIGNAISQQGWDDLSSAAPGFDIRAMRHETLYSRLFQS
ncbi:MAG: urease accessory protein UreF [Nitrospinae bacterium]|nr:urease accessory protein UreF [Nitrospinota bacterium]